MIVLIERHLSRITIRAVIAIPHHLVSNWNVQWQKLPPGFLLNFASVCWFSPHGNIGTCSPAAKDDRKPAGTLEVTSPVFQIDRHHHVVLISTTPRSSSRQRKRIYNKIKAGKNTNDVDKHGGQQGCEDRWDILFRLTGCWKKLPFFIQNGLHLFFPHLRHEEHELQIS